MIEPELLFRADQRMIEPHGKVNWETGAVTVLYLLFEPREEDKRDTDIVLPAWAYDATPREADEMKAHLRKAIDEATADWDTDRLTSWLVVARLDGTPQDELQALFVREILDERLRNSESYKE